MLIDTPCELPRDTENNIDTLSGIFNRTTGTYKFYWFLSILDLVCLRKMTQFTDRQIIPLMCSSCFQTKYRRKVMTGDILGEVITTLTEAAEKIGCKIIEISGQADHIHLLVSFPTSLSIASLVNTLKTVSSRMIRSRHLGILQGGKTGLFWSRSYFAATAGGVTLEILKQYIETQRCQD